MKILTMVAWNRPDYTHQVLSSLAQCRGAKHYTLYAFLEPNAHDVESLFRRCWPFRVRLFVNEIRLGTAMNTFKALSFAFSTGTNFVIHLEDDTVPAPGALEYFEWARDHYQRDQSILSATAYYNATQHNLVETEMIGKPIPLDQWHTIKRRQWFTPWLWGTWDDRWKELERKWVQIDSIDRAWAEHINTSVRGDRFEVYPCLSRSQNIGAENGIHVPSVEWHRKHQFNEEWEGKYDVPSAPFNETHPQAG